MASKLPYVVQPGTILKIFNKVKEAQTPERFTQDFLETKLGSKGGTARQFIPLAKKLGFLNSDGTPSDLYKKFRNDNTSKAAMAEALKIGYREAFERNEACLGSGIRVDLLKVVTHSSSPSSSPPPGSH